MLAVLYSTSPRLSACIPLPPFTPFSWWGVVLSPTQQEAGKKQGVFTPYVFACLPAAAARAQLKEEPELRQRCPANSNKVFLLIYVFRSVLIVMFLCFPLITLMKKLRGASVLLVLPVARSTGCSRSTPPIVCFFSPPLFVLFPHHSFFLSLPCLCVYYVGVH